MGSVADGTHPLGVLRFGTTQHPEHDPFRGMAHVGNSIGQGHAHLAGVFDRCGQRLGNGIHDCLDHSPVPHDRGNDRIYCP